MAKRGQITEEVKNVCIELFGNELTRDELYMLPYIQYCVMNRGIMDASKINGEDRKILSAWEKAGYLNRHMTLDGRIHISVTKEFWDKMCEVLFVSYVDCENR